MEPEANQYMENNLRMRTSSSSILAPEYYQWPTGDQVLMDHSFLFVHRKQNGWTENMSYLGGS